MANYTDEELLFLSNLMHLTKETIYDEKNDNYITPIKDVWDKKNMYKTIGTIISDIDTTQLRQEPLSNHRFDGYISGSEWADMIDAMKSSDICELKLRNVERDELNALSTYFTNKEGNAYVVFRGTSSGEWKDNFLGGCLSDTDQQKKALDYINSIDAEHITVVGHSKGGNKAKYVALLSDKVDRCVAFDGQGFSQLFIEKYQDLIEANKNKITCYALDEDFVNILLYDIYNEKHYIAGNGVDSFDENHSPNSFFYFTYGFDEIFNPKEPFQFPKFIDYKLSGYEFTKSKQAEYIADLHSFVNYISATISEADREPFFSFLGSIAQMALGKKVIVNKDKSLSLDDYTMDDIWEFINNEENADQLGLLVAFILEYEEHNDGITDAILKIMEGTAMKEISKELRKLEKLLGADILNENKIGTGIARWISNQVDKLEDWIETENKIKFIIKYQKQIDWILDIANVSDNLRNLLKNMSEGYKRKKKDVKPVTAKYTEDYNMNANDNVRDYSQEKRDLLLGLTDAVANEKPYDVKKWDMWYRFEDWFGLLDIDRYTNNIDRYYEKVIDINDTTHKQMIQIFDKVDYVVRNYSDTMRTEVDKLKAISNKILSI